MVRLLIYIRVLREKFRSKDKILSVAMFMLLEQSSPATSYARFARNTWLPSNKVMQPSDLIRLTDQARYITK